MIVIEFHADNGIIHHKNPYARMGLNFRLVNQNKQGVFSDGNKTYQRTIVLLLLAFAGCTFLAF